MFRNLIVNVIEGKANKLIAGLLGGAVTWVTAHGFPLDMWISDATVTGIGTTVTSIAVYAIRNYT